MNDDLILIVPNFLYKVNNSIKVVITGLNTSILNLKLLQARVRSC